MLSDSENKKKRRPPKIKRKQGHGVGYSDSQKLDVVKAYLATGNLLQVAASLNIPYITCKTWKKSDWWKELTTDIKSEDNIVLSDRLKKMIDKSLTLTEDRLNHGDYIYDTKRGELVKKPVSLKDAHKVTVDLLVQREVLESKKENDTSMESVTAKLDAIANKFEALASAKPKVEVIDVITGSITEGYSSSN